MLWERVKLFINPIDGRYEDLRVPQWPLLVFRDFTAGLIVAMVAIPLAMGFAMASGLDPVQGIVGGAVAGLIGALFGGSKYQVYGPTAAFIPVIAAVMVTYGATDKAAGHGFLVAASIAAGVIMIVMGLTGMGRIVALVPHSIVVGFPIGIAATIALWPLGEVLGLQKGLGYRFFEKVQGVWANLDQINPWAVVIAVGTFVAIKYLLKVSIYIPAPLIAVGAATAASATILAGKGLTLIQDKYGAIPTDFWVITPPRLPELSAAVVGDLAYFTAAIVFVAAVESLLCSRMADRLADNRGRPFHPNKELWGQGWVNIIVPLLNGFPHTGALARTATNIKLGAVSPLAGIFKFGLKLLLAAYLAYYLQLVPMACIGGVLMYIALNMVKPAEVRQVLAHSRFHVALMVYTAVMVLVTDFLTGVLSAVIIYAALYRFFDRPAVGAGEPVVTTGRVVADGDLHRANGHTAEASCNDSESSRSALGAPGAMGS